MEWNIPHMMSLNIDTGVETSSEVPYHSHGHSCCYLLDFFPNRRLQLNQITWTMFVYFFQIVPKEEMSRPKIGWPCGPRNISAMRDNVPRKELPHNALLFVRCTQWPHLESNVLDISSQLIQLRLQEIFQNFNVTSRCNGYCTAVLILKKLRPQNTKFSYSTPNRNALTVKRSLVKFMVKRIAFAWIR